MQFGMCDVDVGEWRQGLGMSEITGWKTWL